MGTDTVVMDVEDGLALDKKDEAQTLIKQTLQSNANFGTLELAVRINGLETDFAKNDLEAALTCPWLQSWFQKWRHWITSISHET
jgi:citrate lyase beta subunit